MRAAVAALLWVSSAAPACGAATMNTRALDQDEGVTSMAFLPDGRLALLGEYGIAIVDPRSKSRVELPSSILGLRALAAGGRGRYLAAGGSDGDLVLYDVSGSSVVKSIKADTWLNAVALNADETRALTAGPEAARLWDLASGAKLKTFRTATRQPASAVSFAPDGRVLTGHQDGTVVLWDAATGAELSRYVALPRPGAAEEYSRSVTSLVVSADGRRLLAGTDSQGAHLIDLKTFAQVRVFGGDVAAAVGLHPDRAVVMTVSPHDRTQLFAADSGGQLASFARPRGLRQLKARLRPLVEPLVYYKRQRPSSLTTGALSADGALLATGGSDGSVRLYDLKTLRAPRWVELPDAPPAGAQPAAPAERREAYPLRKIAASMDGTLVATLDTLDGFALFDRDTGSPRALDARCMDELSAFAFLPEGRRLLIGHEDGTLSICDAQSGRWVKDVGKHQDHVTHLFLDPSGRFAAAQSYSYSETSLWDLREGKNLGRLKEAETVGITAEGVLFFAVAQELPQGSVEIRTYDPTSGASASRFKIAKAGGRPYYGFLLAPGSPRIAVGGEYPDPHTSLWDADTGKRLRQFQPEAEPVESLALSPDGKVLIAVGEERMLSWDIAAGTLLGIHSADDPGAAVKAVAFSADGRTLLTGHDDGGCALWDLKTLRKVYAYGPGGGPARSSVAQRLWESVP